MRVFSSFYRVLFVFVFVMCVFSVACSDDPENPNKDVDVEVDASGDDVGEDADSSVEDVKELEDVSSGDAGGKTATGEECPEECIFPDWAQLRCDGCAMDWCYLEDRNFHGKPAYCTGGCSVNAECAGYGDGWSCSGSPGVCVKR